MLNEENKLTSKELFFNCSDSQFKKDCFNETLIMINKLKDKKMAIRTNFAGKNKALFNASDLSSLENFIVDKDLNNNFFGIISKNEKSTEIEYQEKIENYVNKKEIKCTDLSKYNILYTDGSVYKADGVNMISGAFILDTEEAGSFSGVEVRETSKIIEHEVLAASLGISKLIEKNLLNKPLCFVTDSNDLAENMYKSLNNGSNIKLNRNRDFKNMMFLIKENKIEVEILLLKSHQSLKSSIYIKNEKVDAMALNAIKEKLEQDSVPNNIRRRKLSN